MEEALEEGYLFGEAHMYGIIYTLDHYARVDVKWSAERILNFIEKKNDEISKLLTIVDNYGMFDTLLGLVIIVDELGTDDVKDWFHDRLTENENSDLILNLAKSYKNKYGGNHLFVTVYDICSFIWDELGNDYIESLSSMDSRNLGLWRMGIRDNRYSEEFCEKLENRVFPYMILMAGDLKKGPKKREMENYSVIVSIYRSVVFDYVNNLFLFMTCNLDYPLTALLKENVNNIAVMDCEDFRRHISDLAKINFYATEKYIQQFIELLNIYEYFENQEDTEVVSMFRILLPLYHLFVGNNEAAYTELINVANSPIVRSKWLPEYMIAIYRCLLITDDEQKREKLRNAFDVAYSNGDVIKVLLEVLKNFSELFSNWTNRKTDELRKEVGGNLDCLKESNGFYLFCYNWVINGKIKDKFKQIISDLEGSDELKIYQAIKDARSLINGLTSHEDTYIRINMQGIEDAFLHDGKNNVFKEIDDCDIYNKNEMKTIRNLKQRFNDIIQYSVNQKSLDMYICIKNKVSAYWHKSESELLCDKVITALRGIQSDPLNFWKEGKSGQARKENSLNNLVAFFLKGSYGEAYVKREEPQGLSSTGKDVGELDITVYRKSPIGTSYQFAIIEALRVLKLGKEGKLNNSDKDNLKMHLDKLMYNYDTRGVEAKIIIIYAFVDDAVNMIKEVKKYLDGYFPSDVKQIELSESKMGHHRIDYIEDDHSKELHVFTAILKGGELK